MLQWGTPKDLQEYLTWSDYFLKRDLNFNKKFIDKYDTTLILPMAGAGSRFFNEGYQNPKPLLRIENNPMIIKAIECLPDTKNKIFICQNSHLEKYKIDENIKSKYPNAQILGINNVTEGQACTCELAFKNFNIEELALFRERRINKIFECKLCDHKMITGIYKNIFNELYCINSFLQIHINLF